MPQELTKIKRFLTLMRSAAKRKKIKILLTSTKTQTQALQQKDSKPKLSKKIVSGKFRSKKWN